MAWRYGHNGAFLSARGLRLDPSAHCEVSGTLHAYSRFAAPSRPAFGGMVICQGQLDQVVPLERASMPGRTVVQWDKEDCADLGIIKVDLLGLGMMAVIKDCLELIPEHYGDKIDLAQLPEDDEIYRTLQRADTIGMFQVESRAQMASLPRN